MGQVIELPDNIPLFRRPPGLPLTCSDEDLAEAVKARLCGADDESLAELLHVPARTVKYWCDSKEWSAITAIMLPDVTAMLKGQLTRLASAALNQIDERLQNGDPVYDNEGGYRGTRKLKARDLATITATVMEQQRNLEKALGSIVDDSNKISLDKLAQALRRHAQEAEIDVTPKQEP